MKPILFAITFGSIFLFISCAPTKIEHSLTNREKFIQEVNYLVDDPELANAQVGLYIEALKDNETIYSHNEKKLFVPASNEKLYTTASALELLDSTYQFKTEFYQSGKINAGVLDGNLIVRGMGDPSISGRFRDSDILAFFKDWADSLKAHGINEIDGDLIGNESFFSGNKLGYGWNWDDEPYWYSAQIGALSFNDNCVDITIKPGEKPGDNVVVTTNPVSEYFNILNTATTISSDSNSTLRIDRTRGKNEIVITGGLPVSKRESSLSITIEDPASWFVTVLADVLIREGISLKGHILTDDSNFNQNSPDSLSHIFTAYSKNLAQMVKVVNKGSHNFYAEQIFKTLGAEINKKGSARESSQIISDWLAGIGVPDNLAISVDGSGLSRMNLVSPFSTAAILRHMYKSKNFKPFYDSLPIAGVDGTIKSRMKDTVAQGVVRAKTGYVRYVRSLSGYTTDRDGNDYLFVIMVNHYSVPTSYINNFQDKICILLTNYKE
ncbi:MAG: D-alanyl-D-alanine carboxypeptidase/D-alanyl-D-alanine-endopeptidase [Calditrichaeota bacterium]|nr:D-alanyl-D-alanine carboxypeptidase/D-alanyl-D-alanine-endopeptidase [Calditrichota bacterium]